jgi:hypothetical protein
MAVSSGCFLNFLPRSVDRGLCPARDGSGACLSLGKRDGSGPADSGPGLLSDLESAIFFEQRDGGRRRSGKETGPELTLHR